MDSVYLIILAILCVLAIFDLIVGVSNDAANFLNSAVGSRAGSRRTIVLVAAVGVLIGSIFSSGMMEIARSGVFMPGEFHFHDVMMIFLAVMLADIILLDLFNTYGLPTSTTVSIVFELLGAAVIVALFKIASGAPDIATHLSAYINSSKALAIISGILSSVVVAFTCGIVVMWVSRLIFSFHYKKSFRWLGALWCGLALTGITYFAVFKGLKGSTLVTKEMTAALNEHIWLYVLYSFAGWTLLMALLQHLFRVNILKISVLAGTMALAMAFAGNDLVNFIGVFMAGQASYEIAQGVVASGGDLAALTMGDLAKPVVADWRYLLGAGIIMVGALMFSRKARTVTETEVNLARQGGGAERFGSTPPARFLVRLGLSCSRFIQTVTPAPVAAFIDRRFIPLSKEESSGAPFDLIRASVNLTVAALLISLATSLKLPLSTTYVTFMVGMGSSLADKAWGRDSAVYRITGVMTVIFGWFFTAFAAFSMAAIIATALMYGGTVTLFVLIPLTAFILLKSSLLHRKRTRAAQSSGILNINDEKCILTRSSEICDWMQTMNTVYSQTLEALHLEDRKKLKQLRKQSNAMRTMLSEKLPGEVIPYVENLPKEQADRGKFYIQVIEYAGSVFDSLSVITRSSFNYIDNNHNGLDKEMIHTLTRLGRHVSHLYPAIRSVLKNNNFAPLAETFKDSEQLGDEFADAIKAHVVLHEEKTKDMRAILLYLSLLNETRSMMRKTYQLARAHRDFVQSPS